MTDKGFFFPFFFSISISCTKLSCASEGQKRRHSKNQLALLSFQREGYHSTEEKRKRFAGANSSSATKTIWRVFLDIILLAGDG